MKLAESPALEDTAGADNVLVHLWSYYSHLPHPHRD